MHDKVRRGGLPLLEFASLWRMALQRKASVKRLHIRGLVCYCSNLRGVRLRSVLCVAQMDRALAAG